MDRLPEHEDHSLHCESAASFSLKTFFAEVKQKDGKGALSQFLVCSERAALLPALPQPPSSGISMFFRMCLYASCLFPPRLLLFFLHHTVRPPTYLSRLFSQTNFKTPRPNQEKKCFAIYIRTKGTKTSNGAPNMISIPASCVIL